MRQVIFLQFSRNYNFFWLIIFLGQVAAALRLPAELRCLYKMKVYQANNFWKSEIIYLPNDIR